MWIFVLFDLPVVTKKQRKEATGFRKSLLDLGFQMCQYSVYIRECSGKERIEALERKIRMSAPVSGIVHLLSVTDKQYGNIITIRGNVKAHLEPRQGQLLLF